MSSTARILGTTALMALIGTVIASALFGQAPDRTGIAILFGCVGAIVGAIAGAGREVAAAMQRPPAS